MRNLDNFINSYDFIKNQLFIYDYNNPDHVHILKMKLWALDGEISQEEADSGIIESDVNIPVDHYNSLLNELTFFDRYIRTKDSKLEKNEKDYSRLVAERIRGQQSFVRQYKDKSTGTFYKNYEQSYSQRPTLLETNQFEELYNIYKIKESNGELSSAFDITSKISKDNLNKQIKMKETSYNRMQDPDETENQIFSNGVTEKKREDDDFVKEMNIAFDELKTIISSIRPELPQPPDETIPNPEYDPGVPGSSQTLPNPITWIVSQLVIINMPSRRLFVGAEKNHSSHKGMIIQELGTGGYRFQKRDGIDLESSFSLDTTNLNISITGDRTGQLEENFNYWFYAHYYVESNSESGSSSGHLVPLNVSYSSLPTDKKQRHDELNKRWHNLNRLREDEIQNVGTRFRLETMFDAEIPDMRPDMYDHLQDKIEEKENIINILKERCLFGEYI